VNGFAQAPVCPAGFAASRARKLREMKGAERDSTQDWLLPAGVAPPLLSELEQRIDEALVVAKASEKAVMAVGDAALEAAQQARRAADLAERATAAALNAVPPAPERLVEDTALRSFSERADRVVARLRALERRPRRARPASVAAGRRRPGG
jgi:hypothetical protein